MSEGLAIRNNCPHCGTASVAFEIQYIWRKEAHEDVFAVCGYCERGVIFAYSFHRHERQLRNVYPSLPSTMPTHLSSRVKSLYGQGLDNLRKNPDASGMTFRKTLDVALKERFGNGGTLWKRIKKAADERQLTPELAEWADQIRIYGNDAAHEEEPFSKKDAESLHAFTRLVLIYLFSLPGMLNEARQEGQPPEADPLE